MINSEIRSRIINILDDTFRTVDECYEHNDESSSKADFSKAKSRIIFPCYSKTYRNGERRISEQELRFLFIESFNHYCEKYGWDAYYSVETPTNEPHSFSGEKTKGGRSARIDVCIHDNQGKRICLIEFKSGNPEISHYKNDLVKLTEETKEGGICFFVQLLESQRSNTMKSIMSKVRSCLGKTIYVCHTITSKYKGTKYVSSEPIENCI